MHKEPPTNTSKQAWEERASQKGVSPEGVLFRGFAPALNHYIHEWHVWAVVSKLLPLLPSNSKVLDMGCGYGRIRRHILEARQDLLITGMDFSRHYCVLHHQQFPASQIVCADAHVLPFKDRCFDAIVGVTVLMYLNWHEREKVIRESILPKLKPGGYGLFIDPGLEFMRLAQTLRPSLKSTPTEGDGFSLEEYQNLGETASIKIMDMGSIPIFTGMLPILMACSSFPGFTKLLLNSIQKLDFRLQHLHKYALQRWVLVKRL